jgi:transcriptional regulator with XRE-family HTH domain
MINSEAISGIPMYDFSVLRNLRKREGRTIHDVSTASGISAAVISKLERNQSQAELETLYKLGRVFGMTATDLMAMAESPLAHRQDETDHRVEKFRFRKVRFANVVCLSGEALAGAKVSRPEIHRDDYEICWVLKGKIRLSLPHELLEIGAGQSLQFDAIQEHSYEAMEDSSFIILQLRKDKRY